MKFLRTSREVLARTKVQYALQRGLLVRLACQICGWQKAQAHHEDYSRPLDVIWLCPQHHVQLHIELRRLRKRQQKAAAKQKASASLKAKATTGEAV
jgi:hypothetical protein